MVSTLMTPHEETLATFDALIRAGKIGYIGVSNWSGWHLMKALATSDRYGYPRYVAHQAYYSLIGRDYEWELMPLGLAEGVGAVVWSPLGWGRLTGKIRRGAPLPKDSRLQSQALEGGPQVEDEYLYKVVDALDAVAAETGKTVPQVALNWLLQRPTVSTVVIGARNEEQLKANLGAVGWALTPDQMKALDDASAAPAALPVLASGPVQGTQSVSSLTTESLGARTSNALCPDRAIRDGARSGMRQLRDPFCTRSNLNRTTRRHSDD